MRLVSAVSLAAVFALPSCSGGSGGSAGAPVPVSIASVALTFGTTLSGPPQATPVIVHAYRIDGSEITGTYPETVTVTLDAECDYALGTSLAGLASALFLLPVEPGPTCPNVVPVPPLPTVSVTASGATVLVAGNGGFTPPGPFLTVSASGVPSISYQGVSTGVGVSSARR